MEFGISLDLIHYKDTYFDYHLFCNEHSYSCSLISISMDIETSPKYVT
jgi:hypothetical protein